MPDAEQEMREMLSFLSLPDIIQILRTQANDMPPDKKQFYLDEINMWGSLGDKQQLISDIINIAEEYVGLEEVMGIFDTLTEGLPKEADRYDVKGVPEGFEWSQETSPTERLKWMKYYQYPGYYSRYEKELIQPHPEQDYADPDLLKREWEEGKVLGLGPVIPEALPKMEGLDQNDQLELRKLMESQIYETVQPAGAKPVPRPFLMEMVYDYLYIAGKEEAAARFKIDGVSSRTRFGFHTKAILRRMFDEMSLEDLYLHWNSIVNYRELPWVNEQYALDRFGGGAMGRNIGPIYEDWKARGQPEEIPNIEWPEELAWAERVSPSEAKQWEY
jgi:hypothetical protein